MQVERENDGNEQHNHSQLTARTRVSACVYVCECVRLSVDNNGKARKLRNEMEKYNFHTVFV